MRKTTAFRHRGMKKGDIPHVLEIERHCFRQPYSREIFEQELQIGSANLWVVPYQKKIIGYLDFWEVVDEIELVSIAVHPEYQGRGVAQHLLKAMVRYGRRHRMRSVVLDVRASNQAALGLYRKLSFKPVGLRKRYYSDNQDDALILKREI